MDCASTSPPPPRALGLLPYLPIGVRIGEGQTLDDHRIGETYQLSHDSIEALSRCDGDSSVGGLCEGDPELWRFFLECNQRHLLNFKRGSSPLSAVSPFGPQVLERFDLSPDKPHQAFLSIVGGLITSLLRHPGFLVLLGVVLAASFATGSSLPAIVGATFAFGVALHEFGHYFVANTILRRPTYCVVGGGHVSVWASLGSKHQQRWFAVAGPLLPSLPGALLFCGSVGLLGQLCGLALLINVVHLLPFMPDGRAFFFPNSNPEGPKC